MISVPRDLSDGHLGRRNETTSCKQSHCFSVYITVLVFIPGNSFIQKPLDYCSYKLYTFALERNPEKAFLLRKMSMEENKINVSPLVGYSSTLLSEVSLQDRFAIQNVPGDGSCFFHCLSGFINGDFLHTQFYRDGICKFIYLNWDQWSEKVSIYHRCGLTQELYKFSMIMNRGWATTCEIEAAVNLLGIHVNVWLPLQDTNSFMVSRFTPQIQIDPTSVISINLLLENGHYQMLRSKQPLSSSSMETPNNVHSQHSQLHTSDTYNLSTNTKCNDTENDKQQQNPCETNSKSTTGYSRTPLSRKRSFGSNLFFSPESGCFKRFRENSVSNTSTNTCTSNETRSATTLNQNKSRAPTLSSTDTPDILKENFVPSTTTNTSDEIKSDSILKPKKSRTKSTLSSTDAPDILKTHCRTLGILYENGHENETQAQALNRKRRIKYRIKVQQKN